MELEMKVLRVTNIVCAVVVLVTTASQKVLSDADWITVIAWSPDGQYIATATSGGSITLLDAQGNWVRTLQEANGVTISALTWHPDSTRLMGAGNSSPTIWNVSTGDIALQPGISHGYPILDADWSPDGTQIATASYDSYPRGVIVSDAVTGTEIFTITDGQITSVVWSPDGSWLAVGKAGAIEIWDPTGTGTLLSTIDASEFQISIDWHPDGNLVAAADVCCLEIGGVVNVYNIETGSLIQTFAQHTDYISQVAWSPDGTRLASAGYDGAIYIWEVATNQSTLFWHGTLRLTTLNWSPNGSQLAFGGENSTFEIQPVPEITGYTPTVPADPPTTIVAVGDTAGLINE